MIASMTGFFPTGRDRGVTVVVEGFFAFVWFGWGQAAAPRWLVVPLAVGAGLSVLLAVAGVVVTKRSAGPLRVTADPAARRRVVPARLRPGDAAATIVAEHKSLSQGQCLGFSWRPGRRRRMAANADVTMVAMRRLTGIFSRAGVAPGGTGEG